MTLITDEAKAVLTKNVSVLRRSNNNGDIVQASDQVLTEENCERINTRYEEYEKAQTPENLNKLLRVFISKFKELMVIYNPEACRHCLGIFEVLNTELDRFAGDVDDERLDDRLLKYQQYINKAKHIIEAIREDTMLMVKDRERKIESAKKIEGFIFWGGLVVGVIAGGGVGFAIAGNIAKEAGKKAFQKAAAEVVFMIIGGLGGAALGAAVGSYDKDRRLRNIKALINLRKDLYDCYNSEYSSLTESSVAIDEFKENIRKARQESMENSSGWCAIL